MSELKLSTELQSSIDVFTAWMESRLAYKGLPGAAVGIIYDQKMVWSKGFGWADVANKKPVTEKTLFRIASISKLFTATALLILRDEGKLQLDDPVVRHLPWFSVKQEPGTPPVLIKHLITHTSGLPREADFPYWSTAEFPTYEEMNAALPGQEQVWRAGKRWKYSNLAVSLAGEVVAAASGMAYEDFVEQRIFQPLEMSHSFIRTLPQDHPLLAVAYGRRMPDNTREIRPFGDCKGITPAANIATSLEDLSRFAMLQFRNGAAEGKQILSGSTLEEMHTVHWLDTDWETGWGWGFHVLRFKNKTIVGHGGSLMGFRTNLTMIPDEKIAVITLTNADDGEAALIGEKAYTWTCEALLKQFVPKPEKKAADPAWQKFAGRYRSPWGDMQILVYNDELIAIDPSLDNPMLALTKLKPLGDNTFLIEEKGGFGSPGEKTVFELDEQGKVVRVVSGVDYSWPIEEW